MKPRGTPTSSDAPGSGRVTIHGVAHAAGVSIGTVSRVINGGRVRATTEQRVRTAIDQLGYEADPVAQSMRRRTTLAVAILAHDISNPIFAGVMSAAQKVLQDAGYMVVLSSSSSADGSEATTVKALSQRRVDAIIGFFKRENDPETASALRAFEGALVLFDRNMGVEADMVSTDNAGGIKQATSHLLELGHRRIALIGGTNGVLATRERARGVVDACKAFGVAPPPLNFFRTSSVDSDYGFQETSKLLCGTPRPTAIIAGSNRTLEGVIAAVRAAHLRIPDDISIVGFDNSPAARVCDPPVTVIARDVERMGTTAAEMVLRRLRAGPSLPPQRAPLQTQIILRGSCGHAEDELD